MQGAQLNLALSCSVWTNWRSRLRSTWLNISFLLLIFACIKYCMFLQNIDGLLIDVLLLVLAWISFYKFQRYYYGIIILLILNYLLLMHNKHFSKSNKILLQCPKLVHCYIQYNSKCHQYFKTINNNIFKTAQMDLQQFYSKTTSNYSITSNFDLK